MDENNQNNDIDTELCISYDMVEDNQITYENIEETPNVMENDNNSNVKNITELEERLKENKLYDLKYD
eukprot:jgi/Orpsp1_1/1180533/evm.model.c7180000073802.1